MIWCSGGVPTVSHPVVIRSLIETSQRMSRDDLRLMKSKHSQFCARSREPGSAAFPLVFTPGVGGSRSLTCCSYAWAISLFWLVKNDIPDGNLLEKTGWILCPPSWCCCWKAKQGRKKIIFGYIDSWYIPRTSILHGIRKLESRVLLDLRAMSKAIHFKVAWSEHCARGQSNIHCTADLNSKPKWFQILRKHSTDPMFFLFLAHG